MAGKYQAPPGYVYDASSGKYYQSTAGSDPKTGKQGRWVTWFDTATGEYAQVFYPDENSYNNNEKNAGQIDKTKKNGAINKKKLIAIITVVALLITGGVGTGIYAMLNRPADEPTAQSSPPPKQEERHEIPYNPPGTENQTVEINFDVTRADWMARLYIATTGSAPDPETVVDLGTFFPDVLPDSFAYHEIQFAADFGWIPEEYLGYDFLPHEGATRNFIAASTVRAAGYMMVLGDEDADIPEDIFFAEDVWGAIMAFHLGLLNEGANEYADFEFMEKCAAFVVTELAALYEMEEFEDKIETSFRENVSDNRDRYAGSIVFNDAEVTSVQLPLNEIDFEVGEIIIFPATDAFPAGVARKITGIMELNGFAHVTTDEVSLLEVFDNLDIAISLDLANEEFTFYWEDDEDDEYNDPYLSYIPNDGISQAMSHVVPLSRRRNPRPIPGIWNPDRQQVMEPIQLNRSIPIKQKVGDAEITGTVGLKKAKMMYTIRYCDILYRQIPLAVRYNVDYTFFAEVKLYSKLYSYKTTLKGVTAAYKDFFTFQVGIPLNLSLEGDVSLKIERTGKIAGGFGLDAMQSPTLDPGKTVPTLEASFKATATTGFVFDVSILGVDAFKTGNTVTLEGKVKGCIYLDTDPREYCLDFSAETYSRSFYELPEWMIRQVEDIFAYFLQKFKDTLVSWIKDHLDSKTIIDMIETLTKRNFTWAKELTRTVDAMRDGLVSFVQKQIDEKQKSIGKALRGSDSILNYSKKSDVTKLITLHYEGVIRESMIKVPYCLRDHRIICEGPKTIAVGESPRDLEVYYERIGLRSKIPLPLKFYEVEILSGQANISIQNGKVIGLKEGTAEIKLTRTFVNLEGEHMLSSVTTTFKINVADEVDLCLYCGVSPCVCSDDSSELPYIICDRCFQEYCPGVYSGMWDYCGVAYCSGCLVIYDGYNDCICPQW